VITPHLNQKGKVAVMVVGHREYWPQFPELRGRLPKNAAGFESLLEKQGVEVVRFTTGDGTQMVDSPELSYQAGVYFKTQDVDLVFLFLTCYVASGRYIQGLLACPAPVVVVGYQKVRDFAKATTFDENAGGGA